MIKKSVKIMRCISVVGAVDRCFVQVCMSRCLLLALSVTLTACSFLSSLQNDGAYLGDRVSRDGAPSKTLAECQIENAIPIVEPKSRQGNPKTYKVRGKTYKVYENASGYREQGMASWYGTAFHGDLTSNGERYNMYAMSAAHKHLPLPSYVEVKNLENNRKIIVRLNDRGPFVEGRIIDLSYAAATKLDILKRGTARVEISVIDPRRFDREKFARENDCGHTAAVQEQKPYEAPAAVLSAPIVTSKPQSQVGVVRPETPASAEPLDGQLINNPSGKVYLQLATYSNPGIANKQRRDFANELKASGYIYGLGLYEFLPDNSITPWYRMRLGPIESIEQARELAKSPLFSRFGKVFPVTDSTLNF